MIVMKFGGTSVGSAERMQEVISLVQSAQQKGRQPVVVLSAMSGITNWLIEGAELALDRKFEDAVKVLDKIRDKHVEAINKLFSNGPRRAELMDTLNEKLDELLILYKGVAYLGELSKRSLDAISGFGELLSSAMVASYAEEKGLNCKWLDARQMVITNENFGRAEPVWDKLVPLCRNKILPHLEKGAAVFTQGFIGSTESGINTTLGRGGSDYSASIIGVALDADEIQIWTDVDGMMSADPRVVKEAKVLAEVSFQEASELAYFGAKVLHPMTIHPAVEKNIPVKILNTLNPSATGTIIKGTVTSGDDMIRAVAAKKNISAIYLSSPNMLMSHGYLAKVFEIFDRHKVAVDLISTSEVSIALTIDTTDKLDQLHKELAEYADVQVMREVSIVSVVGRQFRYQSGIAGKVFKALSDIPVLMISGGASDINLSFVVSADQSDRAVQQLHAEFFNTSAKTQNSNRDSVK
ncbi:MAG: lysine-sensitive aspartokinase 3 [Candidatus Obscuribacterales bacterium]|nr:lysine-sensitive aspartokinase 3 [Candidatus Obscuribacterales bacterium]